MIRFQCRTLRWTVVPSSMPPAGAHDSSSGRQRVGGNTIKDDPRNGRSLLGNLQGKSPSLASSLRIRVKYVDRY